MNDDTRAILIKAIINRLNEPITKINKELCEQNRWSEQEPIHGGDMFFRLVFLTTEQLQEIATACGL